MVLRQIAVGLFLLTVVQATNLIHFYAGVNEKTCFYKELAQDVVLHGKYKIEVSNDEVNFYSPKDKTHTGILIDVYEMFNKHKQLIHIKGTPSGKFTFDTLESGQHKICITARSFFKKWSEGGSADPNIIYESKFKKARILIDFEVGDGQLTGYNEVTGGVEEIKQKVKHLNDKLANIKQEQGFIRTKEEGFRDLSELTNEKVVRWMLIQCGVLLITCIYQLITLERFFIKEKIE